MPDAVSATSSSLPEAIHVRTSRSVDSMVEVKEKDDHGKSVVAKIEMTRRPHVNVPFHLPLSRLARPASLLTTTTPRAHADCSDETPAMFT